MDSDEGATTNRRKGIKFSFHFSPAASEEIERLERVTGLNAGEVFRGALSLYRQAVKGCTGGCGSLYSVDSKGKREYLGRFPG